MRDLRSQLRSTRPLLGSYSFTQSPAVVEVLGHCGLDFVIIDMEHSAIDWSTVEHLIRAAHVTGLAALVRIRSSTEENVHAALDAGADGIMLPFLRDAAQLRPLIRAARYAPQGERHYCSISRAWGYGTTPAGAFGEHARALNDRVVLFGIVESMETIDALPEILDIELGLDAVSLGRGDLATSLNLAGQVQHPLVQAAYERLRACVQAARRPVRISSVIRDVTDAREIDQARAQGVSVFVNVSETALMARAIQTFQANIGAA